MADILVTLATIVDLKGFNVITGDTTTAIVQGFSTPGDGGGGTFVFKITTGWPTSQVPAPDEGIFFSSNLNSDGIWIRQFEGDVNVRFYDATGNHQQDTVKIQAAIDYAAASVGDVNLRAFGYNLSNTVFIPNGSYVIDQLEIKSGVKLRGASKKNTYFSSNPAHAPNSSMIVMASGIIRDICIENISFLGAAEQTYGGSPVYLKYQSCFYFQASEATPNSAGGIWESSFRNLDITRFSGHSIIFEGGGHSGTTNYLLPNQFITFEGVHVDSVGQLKVDNQNFVNQYHALALVGLNAQFSFLNCRFDGGTFLFENDEPRYGLTGRNIYIGPRVASELGTPALINFNTCTIQGGENGFYIESSTGINIFGCWFENFQRAIVVRGSYRNSASINIQNSVFGRSAGRFEDTGTGRLISVDKSQLNVHNNYISDNFTENHPTYSLTTPVFIGVENAADVIGINAFGNYFEQHKLSFTSGLAKNITLTSGSSQSIDILSAKTIFLNNSSGTTKTINSISSNCATGEYIFIRYMSGTGTIELANSGNLYLNGAATLHLELNDSALFVKTDGIYPTDEIYTLVAFLV